MSRTNHNSKGAGYEYWGYRSNGNGKWCSIPGPFTKKMTHKKERHEANQILKKGME